MQVLSTDVVIVGGGAAGCYAALNLHRHRIKTVIVCKGLVGKSGASIFAGNLVLAGRGLGNTEEQARNTAEFLIKYHNQFLIDQHWARACGQWIENVYYPELEEAGLYLRRDNEGNVVTSPGKIRSVAANLQGQIDLPAQAWDLHANAMQVGAAGRESPEAAHLSFDVEGPWSAPTIRVVGDKGEAQPAGDPAPSAP